MWKSPIQLGNTIRLSDMKKEINTIAMEALTTHIQVENFKGTKIDEEYTYIKRKLIQHLEALGNIKLVLVNDKADLDTISEIESNIKRSITDLEIKAAENQKKHLKSQNIKGHLVKTHSASKFPLDYEKSELLKAESTLQQVKTEVNNLEADFQTHTNTENLTTVNNLEEKIVSIYKDLESMEESESNSELKKLKDELFRDLFRCSGKLKKARRKSSVSTTDVTTIQDPKTSPTIDAKLKRVENANNSCEDLNSRINTLTRQISQTLNGEKNGSQVAAKIKVEALKLAWESLREHLYSENVSVEIMMEIIDDLDGLMKDLFVNNRQFKKYVRSHRSGNGVINDEKEKLKAVVERLKMVKRKIAGFHGYYKDGSYVELEGEIGECMEMLKGVDNGRDIKADLAKVRIQLKIGEYLEMLNEKSIKV